MFLVCGEALYDLFLSGDGGAGRLQFDARPGGSPFNVAVGMARLGARVALLTGISNDQLGHRLFGLLQSERVATDFVVRTDRHTTLSLVSPDAGGVPTYAFYGHGSADRSLETADLPSLDGAVVGLHFGSYSIAVRPVADAFADLADRERHRFISLDPNVRLTVQPDLGAWQARIAHLLGRANLVKVSEEDLAILYPGANPLDILRGWAAAGPTLAVLTRGPATVTAIRGSDEVDVEPPSTEVVDTVGAGDAFQACLLAELAGHDEPAQFLQTASSDGLGALLAKAAKAAAITCARRGADLPRAEDLP